MKRDIPKFDTVLLEQLTTKIPKQNSSRHKRVELWSKYIKDCCNFGRHFPCATSAIILVACTRVCRMQTMAQFVLKIEKLSHIMGTTPILEMARAYGLHPRSWLLVRNVGARSRIATFSTSTQLTKLKVKRQDKIQNRLDTLIVSYFLDLERYHKHETSIPLRLCFIAFFSAHIL